MCVFLLPLSIFPRTITVTSLYCYRAVSPKITPFKFGEEPLQTGQTATVTCSVLQGDLPLELSWWFDGVRINDDRQDVSIMTSKKTTMFTIDSVTGGHAGNYTCMARNYAGTAQYTTQLLVNGSSSMLTVLAAFSCLVFLSPT